MPIYTVKVAVKYEWQIDIEAEDKGSAEEKAMWRVDDFLPPGADHFLGCPYVIETREPKEAK